MKKFVINNQTISLAQLDEILDSGVEVVVSNEAKEAIDKCRACEDIIPASKGKLI